MATAFLAHYTEEGHDVVDWVELEEQVKTMKDQLWSYAETMNDGLTVFTTEDKERARKMEELHVRYAEANKAARNAREFVKNAHEARRHGEARMLELFTQGDFTGRMQFVRMKNAAQKVLDCAEPILKKEQDKLILTPAKNKESSIMTETRTVDGSVSVSPLSDGGVSKQLPPTSIEVDSGDEEVEVHSVVDLQQDSEDSVVELHQDSNTDTASSTAAKSASSVSVRSDPQPDLTEAPEPNLEDDDNDASEDVNNNQTDNMHHHKFTKATLHKSARKRKVRKNGNGTQVIARKTAKIPLTRELVEMSEKNGFKVLGKMTRPSEHGYEMSGRVLMCRPCGKALEWGSHQYHTKCHKHLSNLSHWQENKNAEHLMLSQHAEWQKENDVQGLFLPKHIKTFRLDILKMCCLGNIPFGAVPLMEKVLGETHWQDCWWYSRSYG